MGAFPAGSEVLRQVDGGANSLISDVKVFSLAYVDQGGKPTQEPSAVSRVRVELAVGNDSRAVVSEIGLRI